MFEYNGCLSSPGRAFQMTAFGWRNASLARRYSSKKLLDKHILVEIKLASDVSRICDEKVKAIVVEAGSDCTRSTVVNNRVHQEVEVALQSHQS
jgi:hypothetical protein